MYIMWYLGGMSMGQIAKEQFFAFAIFYVNTFIRTHYTFTDNIIIIIITYSITTLLYGTNIEQSSLVIIAVLTIYNNMYFIQVLLQ